MGIYRGLTLEYNHDNSSPHLSVNEGVINAAVNCSHMLLVNSNPCNSMSAIKILFLLCGVFAII